MDPQREGSSDTPLAQNGIQEWHVYDLRYPPDTLTVEAWMEKVQEMKSLGGEELFSDVDDANMVEERKKRTTKVGVVGELLRLFSNDPAEGDDDPRASLDDEGSEREPPSRRRARDSRRDSKRCGAGLAEPESEPGSDESSPRRRRLVRLRKVPRIKSERDGVTGAVPPPAPPSACLGNAIVVSSEEEYEEDPVSGVVSID